MKSRKLIAVTTFLIILSGCSKEQSGTENTLNGNANTDIPDTQQSITTDISEAKQFDTKIDTASKATLVQNERLTTTVENNSIDISVENTSTSSVPENEIDIQSEPSVRSEKFNEEMFKSQLEGINVTINSDNLFESGIVNGQHYSLTIDLTNWGQYTTPDQIVMLSRLFWQCYPKMYERFGSISSPSTNITLAIEDNGYEVADTSGDFIHLHDRWLYNNPNDYDCITHELAHVLQSGWDEYYLEYSDYIERFADYCRFTYALDNGEFNKTSWDLQTVETESTRETSVRFLVWLDRYYSQHKDIIKDYFRVCYTQIYTSDEWDMAWKEILSDTELAGLSIDEVWNMYAESDFAYSPFTVL